VGGGFGGWGGSEREREEREGGKEGEMGEEKGMEMWKDAGNDGEGNELGGRGTEELRNEGGRAAGQTKKSRRWIVLSIVAYTYIISSWLDLPKHHPRWIR